MRNPRQTGASQGWYGAIAAANRDVEAALANPARLGVVTAWVSAIAIRLDCQMVTGASRLGDQLAGVVAANSKGRLTLWTENGAQGTLLVVDGVLASGTQVSRRADDARRHGADRVVGAVVSADPRGLEACRRLVSDEVNAMQLLATQLSPVEDLLI